MYWESMIDFWRMGGYGNYVWGAYGVTVFLIILEVLYLISRRRQAEAANEDELEE